MLETTDSSVVEVLVNAFHQEPLPGVALAGERGVGVVVKVPLDSGWLSGRYARDSVFTGVRARWGSDVVERRAALVERFAGLLPDGMSVPHGELRFVLAQPGVSAVIPGARTSDQLRDNLAASAEPLAPEVVEAVRELWRAELAGNPLPW